MRDRVFLGCKTIRRDPDGVRAQMDESLAKLRTGARATSRTMARRSRLDEHGASLAAGTLVRLLSGAGWQHRVGNDGWLGVCAFGRDVRMQ